MNSKSSKTYDSHGLSWCEIKKSDMLLYEIVASTIHGKI